ncbi:MAG: HAD hydrolase family protein [Acidobacteria bacterium]|nr:HAD hydrolase family protein [Acidobacteriota bacterium]
MTVPPHGPAGVPPGTRVRLIGIDIDGTLLDSRSRLPERNRRAVRAAVERGIHVVLVTGRAYHHAMPIARQLHGLPAPDAAAGGHGRAGVVRPTTDGYGPGGNAAPAPGGGAAPGCDATSCDGTLIVSNGALTKGTDGATRACRLLPRAIARGVVTAMRPRHRGVAAIFDRPGARQYVYEGIDWSNPNRAWYYERNRAYMTRAERIEEALTDDPVQVGFTGSVAEMRALHEAIRDLPEAGRVTPMLTEYPARDFSLLDIIARGCSKGSGLAAWARRLGLEPAEVMAVGDNLNDLEMLEFAGRPVVMGNAVAELKARGWPVAATHDDCGLADAVEAAAGGR